MNYKKTFLFIMVTASIWAFLMDITAIRWGIWYFSTDSLGIFYFKIPIEEYLNFFLLAQELAAIFLLLRRKIYKNG